MPELPEVETIRRHLAPHVEGRVLEQLDVEDPRWCEPLAVSELRDAVEGRVVEHLGRRGKYLIWELSDEVFLLVHLRMTGTLLLDPAPGVLYRRVRFVLSGGHELASATRAASGRGSSCWAHEALEAFFASGVGIEPLGPELTGEALRGLAQAAAARRSRPSCWTSVASRAWGTSTPTRRSSGAVHPLRPAGQPQARAVRGPRRRGAGGPGGGHRRAAARRSTTSAIPTASRERSRTASRCTCAAASRACAAAAEIGEFVAAGRGTYCCETCQKRLANAAASGRVPRHGSASSRRPRTRPPWSRTST